MREHGAGMHPGYLLDAEETALPYARGGGGEVGTTGSRPSMFLGFCSHEGGLWIEGVPPSARWGAPFVRPDRMYVVLFKNAKNRAMRLFSRLQDIRLRAKT